MGIEFDNAQELPPLRLEKPPLVPAEALIAVDTVRLAAGDVPPGILKLFYERVLGLKFVERNGDRQIFSHGRRQVVLDRGMEMPGHLGMLVRSFDESLMRLRDASVGYELLHSDSGLTRTAIVRDPAGNWVQLVETRAF